MQDNLCLCGTQTYGHQNFCTCVRVTPLDRVVGMQQKTASPTASSGCRGRRRASRAARGVIARIDTKPYRVAPQAERACAGKWQPSNSQWGSKWWQAGSISEPGTDTV